MDPKKLLDRFLEAGLRFVAPRGLLGATGPRDGLSDIQALAREAWSEGGEDVWSVAPARAPEGEAPGMSDSDRARVLLQAVIAAAKVDGRLGEAEQQGVLAEMGRPDLSEDEISFLREQLRQSPVLDELARRLTTRAETVEVYAASLLAIDPARAVSRHYLDMLAARLGLERALVDRIEKTVAARR